MSINEHRQIYFSAPAIKKFSASNFSNLQKKDFVGISITGEDCSLNCQHCNSRLLKFMIPATTPDSFEKKCSNLIRNGTKGFLITGGCDIEGKLPINPFVSVLERIKNKHSVKMIFHTRLVDERLAKNLHDIRADAVLLDVAGSENTFNNIYNLQGKTIEDEIRSLNLLIRYNLPIAPHIVVGINYGKLDGEFNALKILKGIDFKTLVLVVFTPLKKTPMAEVAPPILNEVIDFFEQTRRYFPDTSITLGCARPAGKYQVALEKKALELNFAGIAFPSEETIEFCQQNDYKIHYSYFCCSIADLGI